MDTVRGFGDHQNTGDQGQIIYFFATDVRHALVRRRQALRFIGSQPRSSKHPPKTSPPPAIDNSSTPPVATDNSSILFPIRTSSHTPPKTPSWLYSPYFSVTALSPRSPPRFISPVPPPFTACVILYVTRTRLFRPGASAPELCSPPLQGSIPRR